MLPLPLELVQQLSLPNILFLFMATQFRRPLTSRTLSPLKSTRSVSGSKRAHSPDPAADPVISKRVRAAPSPTTKQHNETRERDRQRKQAERQLRAEKNAEFKEKYRRAFPGWKFYFDSDTIEPANAIAAKICEVKVKQLGGVIRLLLPLLYQVSS